MAANGQERALDVLVALNEAPGHPRSPGGWRGPLTLDFFVGLAGEVATDPQAQVINCVPDLVVQVVVHYPHDDVLVKCFNDLDLLVGESVNITGFGDFYKNEVRV